MATTSLVLFVAYLAVAFGLRTRLQVRVVEEPHLRRMHGASWAPCAATTGWFLPRLT